MIFMLPRAKMIDLPPEYPGIVRVREITILGVSMTDKFCMEPHVRRLCTRTAQSLYAFRLLRAHGLSGQRLYDIVGATALARLTYATPAWVGYITADQADFDDLCKKADIRLFRSILSNKNHVLHKFLTPIKDLKYQLRPRLHNHTLPFADTFERHGFILRMLFTF